MGKHRARESGNKAGSAAAVKPKPVEPAGPGAKLSKQQKRDLKRAEKSREMQSRGGGGRPLPASESSAVGAVSAYKRVPVYPRVPAVPEWAKSLGRFLTPKDGQVFQDVKKHAYDLFALDEPAKFSDSQFHAPFQRALLGLEERGFYQFDFTQPAGLGTKVAKTYVTRCLVGKPGITYKYLGLRMFALPWREGETGADEHMVQIGRLNSDLAKRTASLTSTSSSSSFNLTLINRCAPSDETLKEEPMYGPPERITVSWHADSSLQHYSSIAVYHFCSAVDDESWRIALRVVPNAEGPSAGKKISQQETDELMSIPALAQPLASGSVYYLLDEFNHHHQHSVLAGGCERYGSTHRVSREEGHTYQWIQTRALSALREGSGASAKVIRVQQLALVELEFEWLRQFFIQGEKHFNLHVWWHQPMKDLLSLHNQLELNFYKQIATLLDVECVNALTKTVDQGSWESKEEKRAYQKRARKVALVTEESFTNAIEFLRERHTKRAGWQQREQDSIFKTAPKDCRPMRVPWSEVQHTLAQETLPTLISRLEGEKAKFCKA